VSGFGCSQVFPRAVDEGTRAWALSCERGLFKKPALAGRIVADGRFELLTSDEFARYVSALDARRPLATTFPEARILALNDSPKLAAHARRQPGARVISEEPAMVAITLPAGGSPG